MAGPKVTVDVTGNTRPLEREINKVTSKKLSLNLDSKNFSAPLGKIKGDLGEFDKSLAASNARVLAFGASAGAIFAVERALSETVKATIEVEKSLAEVNVILGTSQKKLAGFGNELFNIAKKTGRSFQDVAIAGGELARQGLAMEETLKRTSDAMILARLSGLGVEESVNAITAALNGFRNAALDSTAVVDKLIAVDQAFAVSGADLAEALRRVGSTAEGAGVSLNELLGIVTAAQQITARGGAVIGNSFKTIFTRIQRPRVLEALDQLGVQTKNAAGASLSAIQVLKNLASTFDALTEAQQAQIAELVGGVFQINVLKASLRDLGSQYSIFTNATEIAGRASGESARRNAELNKTLAAGLNETLQNLTKLGAVVGKLTLEPAIRNVLDIINAITEKVSLGDTESKGAEIGKALLGGLGKFISGPGLAIAASVLFKLFSDLTKFAADAFRTFSGLNASFQKQQQLQQGIVNILQQNPKILAQIQRGEISVDTAAKQILASYKDLNAELVGMNNLAAQLAGRMTNVGASVQTVAGVQTIAKGRVKGVGAKAAGYVPNFADEAAAMALSGMYSGTQVNNPRTRRGRVFDGRGGSFMATYNAYEKKQDVIGPNGRRGTIIASPAMQAAARGFIPNFANAAIRNKPPLNAGMLTVKGKDGYQASPNASDLINRAGRGEFQIKSGLEDGKNIKAAGLSGLLVAARNQQRKDRQDALNIPTVVLPLNKTGIFTTGRSVSTRATMDITKADAKKTLGASAADKRFEGLDGLKIGGMFQASMQPIKGLGSGSSFDSLVERELDKPLQNIVKGMVGGSFGKGDQPQPLDVWKRATQDTSGYPQFIGRIFETAINSVLGRSPAKSGTWDYLGGVDASSAPQQELYDNLFGKSKKLVENAQFLDAKRSGFGEPATRTSIAKKIGNTGQLSNEIIRQLEPAFPRMAQGFVPNFAGGLRDAIKRESLAGVSKGAMRVGQDRRLATQGNPLGLAVTNTRDEPRGLRDVLARGYVPNFAKPATYNEISKKEADRLRRPAKDLGEDMDKAGGGFEKVFAITSILSIATATLASATEGAGAETQRLTANINAAVSGISVAAIAISTLPGPVGIAIGAFAGIATAMFAYQAELTEMQSSMANYKTALDSAAVGLQEQGNAIQQAQQALSGLSTALSTGNAQQVQAAQAKYSEALSKLPEELRRKLLRESDPEKRQDILGAEAGKVAKKSAANTEAIKTNELLQEQIDKAAKEKKQSTIYKALAGIAAGVTAIVLYQKGGAIIKAIKTFATAVIAKSAVGTAAAGGISAAGAAAGGAAGAGATLGIGAIIKAGAAMFVSFLLKAALAVKAFLMKWVLLPAAILQVTSILSKVVSEISGIIGSLAGAFGLDKIGSMFDALGAKAAGAARNLDLISQVKGFFNRKKENEEFARGMASERYGLSQKDILKGTGLFSNIFGGGKATNRMSLDEKGMAQMQSDADAIFSAIGRNLTTQEQKGLTDAAAEGEESLIKYLQELGLSAAQAGTFVKGAGGFTEQLAYRVKLLSINAEKAEAETARLQAALDRQAAAAAAAQAAIERTAKRAYEFSNAMIVFATNVQKAKNRQQEFTKELMTATLKGGASLAANFQTSFQQTRTEGQIASLEINQNASKKQEELRRKGSQDVFAAVSKFGEIGKIFEGLATGGGTQVQQDFFNDMNAALLATSGMGGAATLAALQQVINDATGQGGALEGQKIEVKDIDGMTTLLTQQLGELQKAEMTRLEALRMQSLQTRLAQAQNKINQEMAAGGGIKAFLDPKQLDAMEEGFNDAVTGFVSASNRGDTVKTGQFAGQLLGNLNQFMGGPMMGAGAEGLKDLTQKGLEQSLRGRAFARADVLDQAAARTGNQDLARAADNLRNLDFASMARTQVAAEFKRDQMPANIEAMLNLQQALQQIEAESRTANVATAQNTSDMLDALTDGAFSPAASNIAVNIPTGEFADIATSNQAVATALEDLPINTATAFAEVLAGQKLKDLQEERGQKALDMDQAIKEAYKDGVVTPEELAGIEKMAEEINSIDQRSAAQFAGLSQTTQNTFDPAMAEMIRNRGLLSNRDRGEGGLLHTQGLGVEAFQTLGPVFSQAMADLEEMRKLFGMHGQSLGDFGDTNYQDNDFARSRQRIGQLRNVALLRQQQGGEDSARDFLMGQVRNIQTGVSQGRFDKEQAALQLAALQELIERVDEGKLGTEASDNEEFFRQLLAQLDSKPMVNNIQITIDPKISLSGQPEIIELQTNVANLREAAGAKGRPPKPVTTAGTDYIGSYGGF